MPIIITEKYKELIKSPRLFTQNAMLELNCSSLEEELEEGNYERLVNFAPQLISAYGAFEGTTGGDRFRPIIKTMIERLELSGQIELIHKFFSKTLNALYSGSTAMFHELTNGKEAEKELLDLFEYVQVPDLIAWHERYLSFSEKHGDIAVIGKYKKRLEAIKSNIWPRPMCYPKDRRPMTQEVFWELIGKARGVSEDGDDSEVLEDLKLRLLGFSQVNVFKFHKILLDLCVPLHSSETWAVGHIVSGNLSDDGFHYFKPWIVLQGEEFYRAFLSSPSKAMLGVEQATQIEFEEMLLLAEEVFSEQGWSLERLEKFKAPVLPELNLEWETEELPARYPDLWAKFIGKPLD